jgi:DNA-directed RNA polymerase specialized sigma24 family protein
LIEGDLRTALGVIVHQNSGKWIRFILAILKNKEDAEDVLQEAIRRILTYNRPLPSQEQVKMYLSRIIGNTAFELYKNRKRERMKYMPIREYVFLSAGTRRQDAIIEEREQTAEKELLLHLLRCGLKHLPLKQYEALHLTILNSRGCSIRDAVAISGIPYSTLRHRSKQGLRTLRRFVERELRQRIHRE